MRVELDEPKCVASGQCVMASPEVFDQREDDGVAILLAEEPGAPWVKYIHGEHGQGTWTFFGGHDPEDPQHQIGDAPTDLALHPHSPGYRLILNNVLFPAAKKKELKT